MLSNEYTDIQLDTDYSASTDRLDEDLLSPTLQIATSEFSPELYLVDTSNVPTIVFNSSDPEKDYADRMLIVESIINTSPWSKRCLTFPYCPSCDIFNPITNSKARRCAQCKNTIRWKCRLCGLNCWDGGSSSYASHVNDVLQDDSNDVEHEPFRQFLREHPEYRPQEKDFAMKSYGKRNSVSSASGKPPGLGPGGDTEYGVGKRARTNAPSNADPDGDYACEMQHSRSDGMLVSWPSTQEPAAMYKINSEPSLPNFSFPAAPVSSGANSNASARRSSRSSAREKDAPLTSFDLLPALKPWDQSSSDPNPADVIIGKRTVGFDAAELPIEVNYTLADYIAEIQENYCAAQSKIKGMEFKNSELLIENARLRSERDLVFSQVKTLQAGVQSKKETTESMTLVPKLLEKSKILRDEIEQLSTKLYQAEKELHVHRVTAHSAFSKKSSIQPFYFGSLEDLENKASLFYQIVSSSLPGQQRRAIRNSGNADNKPHMLLTSAISHKRNTLFDLIGAHPNVARVYTTTVGEDTNVVMEYLHGVSVCAFLRVLRIFTRINVARDGCGLDDVWRIACSEEMDTGDLARLTRGLESLGCDTDDLECFVEMFTRFPKINSIGNWSGDLIYQLCQGVLFLHKQNLVHRDLHMENIQIEPDLERYFADGVWIPRRLVVVGFGRLGRQSDPITLQKYADLPERPEHLAPENFMSSADSVGEGVDVYALGVLLTQLWTSGVFGNSGDVATPPTFLSQMVVDQAGSRLNLDCALDYISSAVW